MCDRTIFEDPFMLVYCPDKYKVQKIHDECIDGCMEALKFISDWFVKSKMMKKLLTALYADDNILSFNEDSVAVIFSCNEMGILSVDLNSINLYDVRYLVWHS